LSIFLAAAVKEFKASFAADTEALRRRVPLEPADFCITGAAGFSRHAPERRPHEARAKADDVSVRGQRVPRLSGLFEGAFDEGEAALGLFAQKFFLFAAFA
jgi:hypothetical protein